MRAAIYSRKSNFTGKGESIENQIQLSKEYGDKLGITEFIIYEDEGFSGGNTNRPSFKQLMIDAKSNKFDYLICYRLDRISRNVADFSATLEELQKYNIEFVSIKEQFDTSTPMGRAMVYISSVFAQLERETIAERIKDNMYELAKTGRWLGGRPPLGFDSDRITYLDEEYKERSLMALKQNAEETKIVKYIFDTYYKERSLHKVAKECLSLGLKGKHGGELYTMSLDDILRNSTYVKSNEKIKEYLENKGYAFAGTPNGCGILTYGKSSKRDTIAAVAKHKGIIDADVWLEIQESLDIKSNPQKKALGTSKKALLTGTLKCAICGNPMRVNYGKIKQDGTRNYYYVCTMKAHSGKTRCNNPNANGSDLETSVISSIKDYNKDTLISALNEIKSNSNQVEIANKIKNLEKEVASIDKKIQQLLSKLSDATSTVSNYILSEIERLDKVKKDSIIEINNLNDSSSQNMIEDMNIDLILEKLSRFNELFSLAETTDEKRSLIEDVVDTITFDGNTGKIDVFYWGAKKK